MPGQDGAGREAAACAVPELQAPFRFAHEVNHITIRQEQAGEERREGKGPSISVTAQRAHGHRYRIRVGAAANYMA